MHIDQIRETLASKGLKVTPQRIAVLESFTACPSHPTAKQVVDFIRKNNPNISAGTVYNTLDTFVEKNIIIRVKTDRDVMRYDAVTDKHHHLYCGDSDRIEDYFDKGLDTLLQEYFSANRIPDFEINEIRLQLNGKFSKNKS